MMLLDIDYVQWNTITICGMLIVLFYLMSSDDGGGYQ